VLAQVPIDEQSFELRHVTVASLAQVPSCSGQVPGSELHAAPPTLHVPSVRHCALPKQGVICDHGWPFAFEQVPGVAEHCVLLVQTLPPDAQVPFFSGQVALEVQDAAAWHMPVPMPVQFEFCVQGVTPSEHVL